MADWLVIGIVLIGAVLMGVAIMGVVTIIEASRSRRQDEAMPEG
jgi:hypothetical protein